ncbi:Uncharacterised protein [uncultured archaeon]|nr:Uncharacterised protein [uncultured archaeon]
MARVDISNLFGAAGIKHSGFVDISGKMPQIEENPKEDWLYLSLIAFRKAESLFGNSISSAAAIGSGNGVDAIAMLRTFKNLRRLQVTDIVPEILPKISQNIKKNSADIIEGREISYKPGRDCLPVEGKVDLIYANLPLMMASGKSFGRLNSNVALADMGCYFGLSNGKEDLLYRYSLLPQLGFLLSAGDKLGKNGRVLTMVGGRLPGNALDECFSRAGMKYEKFACAFKSHSDIAFLEEYARHEAENGLSFEFYDYEKARDRIREKIGVEPPAAMDKVNCTKMKPMISSARINAAEALALHRKGGKIGHIAYALLACKK